jgi:hypothetical protein
MLERHFGQATRGSTSRSSAISQQINAQKDLTALHRDLTTGTGGSANDGLNRPEFVIVPSSSFKELKLTH